VSRAGGGALPLADIPTVVVAIEPAPDRMSVDALEAALRLGEPCIIARIHEGRLLIDPRTLSPAEQDIVAARVAAALGG
jgi:L-seryl-tRNA(Ser) seleniumtransferase